MKGIESSLPIIRNMSLSSFITQSLNLPSVVKVPDPYVESIFPWRSMLAKSGSLNMNFDNLINLSDYMQLCLIVIPEKYK